jgi:hypothetical protein
MKCSAIFEEKCIEKHFLIVFKRKTGMTDKFVHNFRLQPGNLYF